MREFLSHPIEEATVQKTITAVLLVILVLTACANVNPTNPKDNNSTPLASALPDDQQPTPDDSRGVTPPAPSLGMLEPADLPLEVIAWGAPTDGRPAAAAQAVVHRRGSSLDAAWLASLPVETQAALPEPAEGEWIILLFGGSQPCPAYHIAVQSARIEERTLKVTWQVLPPEPGTGCASVIAYPYLLLRLPGAAQYVDAIEFLQPGDE